MVIKIIWFEYLIEHNVTNNFSGVKMIVKLSYLEYKNKKQSNILKTSNIIDKS